MAGSRQGLIEGRTEATERELSQAGGEVVRVWDSRNRSEYQKQDQSGWFHGCFLRAVSSRNWLHIIALGGFLAVTLLSNPVLAKDDNREHQEEAGYANYAIQQAGPKLGPIPFDRKEPAKTDWANPKCNKPKDHDEADLCVQREVAHIAHDSLISTYVQIGLGVIGAILLLSTLGYTRQATRASTVAANAARDSADAAKQAYIADHRAWLRVDVTIGDDGVTIDGNGARLNIYYRIENIGNAPARNITTHAWLVAFNGGVARPEDLLGENGDFPVQIQRKRCNEIRRKPFDVMGFSLFPNEVWPDVSGVGESPYGIHLNRSEMQRAIGEGNAEEVSLFIVGCVDYTFPSDSAIHHQTWFSYSLAKRIETYKTDTLITYTPTGFQIGDDNIPRETLMVAPDPFSMGRHAD